MQSPQALSTPLLTMLAVFCVAVGAVVATEDPHALDFLPGSDHRRRQHESASPKKRTGPEWQYLDRDVRLLSSTAVDETTTEYTPPGDR
jgi:hypothetical protein